MRRNTDANRRIRNPARISIPRFAVDQRGDLLGNQTDQENDDGCAQQQNAHIGETMLSRESIGVVTDPEQTKNHSDWRE